MINIAIVEDDGHYSDLLERYLTRYEETSEYIFNITMFEDGEDIVTDYKANFDIILMDIEMKFMNGMEAAEKIREYDSEVVIIFITNMAQYAIKGYSVNALDFVLKPINYYAFSQRIDRALSRMKRREKKYIPINVRGGFMKINEDSIYYMESQNHNLIIYTTDGEYTTRATLREMTDLLDEKKFFRCNKCYLINLEYVTGYINNDVVVANNQLQISRSRKKALLDILNNYINEVSK